MDFWILGVGALVLIGLAVWIVWPTAAAPVAEPVAPVVSITSVNAGHEPARLA